MSEPDYKRFAQCILAEAKPAADWHQAKGMKPACTPGMPLSVALSILRDARHNGIDVDALLAIGQPVPAMAPLHPDKPEPEIKVGDVWAKKASGKTSVNRPQVRVIGLRPGFNDSIRILHVKGRLTGRNETKTERVFRRDWEPA